ncbi:Hypothetical protein, putative [Bodo saltans]|uniref:Uncharacterized protein n=1 Tax=Bodo saltans TaxID=75058 RepID=A0A0S4JP49_BODSA|nr:Hypothetical protein, putative [Bodo saltans]|eukprot:CUG91996.1 Hypothetical protein, putative [Bodo saltans]
MSVAPQQVDLGTMSRESIIDVAKRQNVQIKEKNTKIQELTRALAEAQSNTPLQTLVNEKEDAIIKLREALHEKVSHIEQLELKTHSWKEKVMEMANNDQRTIDALRTQLASTTHQLDALKAEAQQLRQTASPPKAAEETQEPHRQLASLTTAHDELSKQYAEQERTSQAAYNALKQSAIQRFQQMQTAADELPSVEVVANNQIQQLTTQNVDRNTANKHTAELEAEVAGSHSSGEREAHDCPA